MCVYVCVRAVFSHVQLFVTPWTIAYQPPPFMEFSRQEYWNGLPFPSPGDLPNLGIAPGSPALQADSLPSEPPGEPTEAQPLTPSTYCCSYTPKEQLFLKNSLQLPAAAAQRSRSHLWETE